MFNLITGLGDSAFLIPAPGLLVAYCLYLRSSRAALIWISTLALCAGLTIALKTGFRACGGEVPAFHIRSPSGHTSLSTTFYGCFALMIAIREERGARLSVLLTSILLVAAIAVSRVVLEAHTVVEVIAGLLIGLCCVGWFAFRYLSCPPTTVPWQPVAVALLALALLTYGWHIDFEVMIGHLARLFRAVVPVCA
jgi:membrane-associated phospholipid phosphatase